jgi:arylsulfatase A-like enzyme
VQVTASGWDHHQNIRQILPQTCAAVDKPVAGLLADLAARGLLDETLVVCTGEFGRSPYDQDISLGKDGYETFGRGHNPYGFSAWLAGGGIKGGLTHGATDEYGYRAVEGKVHVHDLHATILHLLGLDHERLTYHHGGRDYRLTDVYGRVVTELLA